MRFSKASALAVAAAVCVAALVPSRAFAATDYAELSTHISFLNGNVPIAITYASVYIPSPNDAKIFYTCFTIRNLSDKPMSSVRVHVEYDDPYKKKLSGYYLDREGSFGPNVPIVGNAAPLSSSSDSLKSCFKTPLITGNAVAAKMWIDELRYADGSVWKYGDGYTQTYAENGGPADPYGKGPVVHAALKADGTANTAAGPSSNVPVGNAPTPINIGGATGGGGVLGTAGTSFGAIALQPGTRNAAVATDAANDDAAVYNAMAKCNAQTAGANNCQIMVKFSGTDKCAALAVDGVYYGIAKGPDTNSANATALANMHANGGTIGNNIVASACNSH